MSRTMTTEKNRRIRVAILGLLKTEYPGSIDLKMLQFSLDNLNYTLLEGELNAHLRYLEEKGYAKLQRKEGYGFSVAWAKLTADGWDLLDGHRHEAGIDGAL